MGYRAFGGADVQEFFDRPVPSSGPHEAVDDRGAGFARAGAGTYAGTTLLSAGATARIPEALPETWAATIPVAGTTALDVLDQVALPPGRPCS
ncbi:hypothetical protein [Streptomyces liangshanensis]|uniref:hypothetical protein n=1 Tax=Streptomyces liangshanensis TaxID=2717324 RepID=UPI0036DB0BA6